MPRSDQLTQLREMVAVRRLHHAAAEQEVQARCRALENAGALCDAAAGQLANAIDLWRAAMEYRHVDTALTGAWATHARTCQAEFLTQENERSEAVRTRTEAVGAWKLAGARRDMALELHGRAHRKFVRKVEEQALSEASERHSLGSRS